MPEKFLNRNFLQGRYREGHSRQETCKEHDMEGHTQETPSIFTKRVAWLLHKTCARNWNELELEMHRDKVVESRKSG